MSSLFSGPKVPSLPAAPDPAIAKDAASRERKNLLAGKTQTILTSGQGVSGASGRKLLGGN
jgi:hypothetical protein